MSQAKTKNSGGFFKGFIASLLLVIIIVGAAYVANSMFGFNIIEKILGPNYSKLASTTSTQNGNMNMQNSGTQNNSSSQNGNMNMQGSSSNNMSSTPQYNFSLQNSDSIEKIIGLVKDALKSTTLDPYGTQAANTMGNINNQQAVTGQSGNASGTQGNTVVNVYPSNSGSGTQNNTSGIMGNMGTTYDENKMEQLHKGLYKISIGEQLLEQLKDNLTQQAEQVIYDPNNPSTYYYTEYNLTIQNKKDLETATNYINAAGELMNINPYTSQNGLIYDKDRMQEIHNSIFTLAQVTTELNKLNDNLNYQTAIYLGYIQNGYDPMNSNMNMNMGSSFSNINIQSIGNIILIVFVSAFIIGLLGFIFSLTKPKKQVKAPIEFPEKTS